MSVEMSAAYRIIESGLRADAPEGALKLLEHDVLLALQDDLLQPTRLYASLNLFHLFGRSQSHGNSHLPFNTSGWYLSMSKLEYWNGSLLVQSVVPQSAT